MITLVLALLTADDATQIKRVKGFVEPNISAFAEHVKSLPKVCDIMKASEPPLAEALKKLNVKRTWSLCRVPKGTWVAAGVHEDSDLPKSPIKQAAWKTKVPGLTQATFHFNDDPQTGKAVALIMNGTRPDKVDIEVEIVFAAPI